MNTNRKEIARFEDVGIFADLGRELIKRGVVFEYIYTGGNIYLIQIGNQEEKHILINEEGGTSLYANFDEADWIDLHEGHSCYDKGPSCTCTKEQLIKLCAEISYTVLGAVTSCSINQTTVPAKQTGYGVVVP